ncbi:SEP-domain-containing protein [Pholiota conissans]|uniref:SEP-domain-containing protein n=1 Tax=Pholiota conissans TaxID=109636 RepID=A0A9P5Z0U7_9AGAR|nr:SEP-domain-containing protein [Pholiota conissans]
MSGARNPCETSTIEDESSDKIPKQAPNQDAVAIPGPAGEIIGDLITEARKHGKDFDPEPKTAVRSVTFWRNGFQFQDGELRLYSDPAQTAILENINAGRAPPSVLNVQEGELVELRVVKRTDEDYTPPPMASTKTSRPNDIKPPTLVNVPPRPKADGNGRSQSKWNVRSILRATGLLL